jgi:hypothetical protein
MNEATFKLIEEGRTSQSNVTKCTIMNIMKISVDEVDVERASVLSRVALGMSTSRTLRDFLIPELEDHLQFNRILDTAKLRFLELTATPDVQARLAEVAKTVISE